MSVDLRPWNISRVSSHTFHLALPTPVASLRSHVGDKLVGPRAPLEDLDKTCNSSYFLKGVMKMADVDINPFDEHGKTDKQPDTGETVPFTPEPEQEISFGGGKLSQPDSKNRLLKGCIESYLKSLAKPQKHSISTISNLEMENCTTKRKEIP